MVTDVTALQREHQHHASLSRTTQEQRGDLLRGVAFKSGSDVAVDIERYANGAVPEPLLHDARVYLFSERERGLRVAHVVKPDSR